MASKATKKTRNPAGLPETNEGFVRLPDVLRVYPVGKSSFLRGVQEGKYPAPVKLSPRVSAWRVSDIRDLLASLDDAS